MLYRKPIGQIGSQKGGRFCKFWLFEGMQFSKLSEKARFSESKNEDETYCFWKADLAANRVRYFRLAS